MEMCYDGALVMPSSYAVMDEEEMEYLEAGKYYGVNLSKNQCDNIAYYLTVFGGILTISSLICSGIALIPGLQAAVVGASYYGALATVCGLSGWFFTEATRKGGCYIGFDSKKKKMVYGWGKYKG